MAKFFPAGWPEPVKTVEEARRVEGAQPLELALDELERGVKQLGGFPPETGRAGQSVQQLGGFPPVSPPETGKALQTVLRPSDTALTGPEITPNIAAQLDELQTAYQERMAWAKRGHPFEVPIARYEPTTAEYTPFSWPQTLTQRMQLRIAMNRQEGQEPLEWETLATEMPGETEFDREINAKMFLKTRDALEQTAKMYEMPEATLQERKIKDRERARLVREGIIDKREMLSGAIRSELYGDKSWVNRKIAVPIIMVGYGTGKTIADATLLANELLGPHLSWSEKWENAKNIIGYTPESVLKTTGQAVDQTAQGFFDPDNPVEWVLSALTIYWVTGLVAKATIGVTNLPAALRARAAGLKARPAILDAARQTALEGVRPGPEGARSFGLRASPKDFSVRLVENMKDKFLARGLIGPDGHLAPELARFASTPQGAQYLRQAFAEAFQGLRARGVLALPGSAGAETSFYAGLAGWPKGIKVIRTTPAGSLVSGITNANKAEIIALGATAINLQQGTAVIPFAKKQTAPMPSEAQPAKGAGPPAPTAAGPTPITPTERNRLERKLPPDVATYQNRAGDYVIRGVTKANAPALEVLGAIQINTVKGSALLPQDIVTKLVLPRVTPPAKEIPLPSTASPEVTVKAMPALKRVLGEQERVGAKASRMGAEDRSDVIRELTAEVHDVLPIPRHQRFIEEIAKATTPERFQQIREAIQNAQLRQSPEELRITMAVGKLTELRMKAEDKASRAGIRDAEVTAKEFKDMILKDIGPFVKDLPKELQASVKAQMIRAVSNVRSQDLLDDAYWRLSNLTYKAQLRDLRGQLKGVAGELRAASKTMPKEIYDAYHAAFDPIEFTTPSARREAFTNMVAKMGELNPDLLNPESVTYSSGFVLAHNRAKAALEKGAGSKFTRDMLPHELEALIDYGKALLHRQRLQESVRLMGQEVKAEELEGRAIDEASAKLVVEYEERGWLAKGWGYFFGRPGSQTMPRQLDRLGITERVAGVPNAFKQVLGDAPEQAELRAMTEKDALVEHYRLGAAERGGQQTLTHEEYFKPPTMKRILSGAKYQDGRSVGEVEINEQELMGIVLVLQDAGGRHAALNGFRFRGPDGKLGKVIVPTEETLRQLESLLTPQQEGSVAAAFATINGPGTALVNDFWTAANGYPLIRNIEAPYVPLTVDVAPRPMRPGEYISDIANRGRWKERVPEHKNPLIIDYFAHQVDRAFTEAARLVQMAPNEQARTFINRPKVRAFLAERLGPEWAKTYVDWLADMEHAYRQPGPVTPFFRELTQRAYGGLLPFNVPSTLIQLWAFPLTLDAGVTPGNWARGVPFILEGLGGKISPHAAREIEAMQQHPALRERWSGGGWAQIGTFGLGEISNMVPETFRATERPMIGPSLGDRAMAVGTRVAVRLDWEAANPGKDAWTPEAIAEINDRLIAVFKLAGQPTGLRADQSRIARSARTDAMGVVLQRFQSAVNALQNYLFRGTDEAKDRWRAGDKAGAVKGLAKNRALMIIQTVAVAATGLALRELISRDEKRRNRATKTVGQRIMQVATQAAQDYLEMNYGGAYARQALGLVWRWLGERRQTGRTEDPVQQVALDLYRLSEAVQGAIDKAPTKETTTIEDVDAIARRALRLTGVVAGKPLGPIYMLIRRGLMTVAPDLLPSKKTPGGPSLKEPRLREGSLRGPSLK